MGQSRGWFANRNSITPSRALWVSGELVLTTMPGCTGQAHDATGFGALSTSTRHIRQLPAIMSFLVRDIVSGAFGRRVSGTVASGILMVAISENIHGQCLIIIRA